MNDALINNSQFATGTNIKNTARYFKKYGTPVVPYKVREGQEDLGDGYVYLNSLEKVERREEANYARGYGMN